MYLKYLHVFFGWRTGPSIEERSRERDSKAPYDLEK